jgi:hypothetical protein
MRTCKLFDKYHDRELSPEEREQFESHLAGCVDCQTKRSLIYNIAFVLRQEEMRAIPDLAGRIASRAFSQHRTWDSLIISLLRPGPALVTLTLALALFSSLWIFINRQPMTDNYTVYKNWMREADTTNLDTSLSQIREDNDLLYWLNKGDIPNE